MFFKKTQKTPSDYWFQISFQSLFFGSLSLSHSMKCPPCDIGSNCYVVSPTSKYHDKEIRAKWHAPNELHEEEHHQNQDTHLFLSSTQNKINNLSIIILVGTIWVCCPLSVPQKKAEMSRDLPGLHWSVPKIVPFCLTNVPEVSAKKYLVSKGTK